MAGVADLDVPVAREQPTVARVAGGQHAVEHVDAVADRFDDVLRRADAHQVARAIDGEPRRDMRFDAPHLLLRLADRQAADRIAVEADAAELRQRLLAQVLEHAALDDPEQRVGAVFVRGLRPRRPAQRQLHRRGDLVARARIRRALVEDHRNVGIEGALDLHRQLRRQVQAVAVDRRGEGDAFLVNFAQGSEAEYLKSSRIGEDRVRPAHEAVQPGVSGDDFNAGTQPQVEGVAEHDLGAERLELVGRHRLDRAVGADRHEDRRLDGAVGQREPSAPRGAASGGNLELHRGDFSSGDTAAE